MLIDQLATSHIDQTRGWLHRSELLFADETMGAVGQGKDQHDKVSDGEQSVKIFDGAHQPEVLIESFRCTHSDDFNAQGTRGPADGPSDLSGADNHSGLARQHLCVTVEPSVLRLESDGRQHVLGEDQHHRNNCFRD